MLVVAGEKRGRVGCLICDLWEERGAEVSAELLTVYWFSP